MNNKIFSKILLLGIILAVTITGVSIFIFQDSEANNSTYDGPPRAVIIDQLYDDIPSKYFHDTAADYFKQAGYELDIFTTKEVTVDLFKKLPQMNYQYVVIRTHGVTDATNEESVVLFTGEKYQEDLYIQEQLFGQIKKGTPLLNANFALDEHDESDWTEKNGTFSITTPVSQINNEGDEYFLVPPKFVDENMDGKFHGTTFLLGGCKTMANPSMAESLIQRGASSVVGWDDNVGSYDNDLTLLKVLEESLLNNALISDAVDMAMKEKKWGNPEYLANLKYLSEPNL